MSVLNIEKYPSQVLKQKASPVEQVDDSVRALMDDMLETMYASSGVGLAAPQVGISTRVIVVDANINEDDDYPVLMLANPEIIEAEGSVEFEEGCLSVPEFTTLIKRPSEVTVRAMDRDGKEITIEADGLLAIVLQHEIDHLEGKLILDRASTIKREFYRKRLKKIAAAAG
jgi:peptide deformylase